MVHRDLSLLARGCSHLVACWAIKAPQVQIEGGVPSRLKLELMITQKAAICSYSKATIIAKSHSFHKRTLMV
ncbi:hypothetical protein BDE02_02G132200 [Populus trichocarpa]|nr:hypothetical protein BDE02_02G132200 [Populus trichocarpa]